jgi:hypothetical protein
MKLRCGVPDCGFEVLSCAFGVVSWGFESWGLGFRSPRMGGRGGVAAHFGVWVWDLGWWFGV